MKDGTPLPIVDILGWDPQNPQLRKELPITRGLPDAKIPFSIQHAFRKQFHNVPTREEISAHTDPTKNMSYVVPECLLRVTSHQLDYRYQGTQREYLHSQMQHDTITFDRSHVIGAEYTRMPSDDEDTGLPREITILQEDMFATYTKSTMDRLNIYPGINFYLYLTQKDNVAMKLELYRDDASLGISYDKHGKIAYISCNPAYGKSGSMWWLTAEDLAEIKQGKTIVNNDTTAYREGENVQFETKNDLHEANGTISLATHDKDGIITILGLQPFIALQEEVAFLPPEADKRWKDANLYFEFGATWNHQIK